MPTLKITMEMDNEAFTECNGSEAARILRKAADMMDGSEWHIGDYFKLRDFNGNTVGEAKVTR